LYPSIFAGIFFASFVLLMFGKMPNSPLVQYDKAITECEKSLPSDKNCHIVGVPNESK
jgi:hypothetical protein